ncbi:uncharacterized protein B0I36DRAFT_322381 [Microdochium trichocladiopsis]|uniref:RING-type domain-containing protein n=1 Tax=Microdochium trichocladiopsis TaxID=1682393 RepID=A0A9P9BQB0_9PEZI|nr:uncharacterized protein B0I36DRAFT_322381 [Microdochium trichocladiopsis]KAH7030752.1 hypothetical protein B0I36DRAFT_322381 [Microdochium trichocladiopsis]
MSSGPTNPGAKSLPAPSPSYSSSSQPISVPSSGFDSSSRRSSGLSNSSLAAPTPRKGQGLRKQHRNQRRPLRAYDQPDEDDAMAELRAVQKASSRRGQTSITHLLDYSAPLRHVQELHHHSRTNRRHPAYPGSGYHTVDKARFVHANYRFVVDPNGSYASQASDADKHLDWSNVLQIIASAESQTTACPICLSDPVAPRMAHCGHIFCLPCLLRFMSSTSDDEAHNVRKEAKWKKCPICEDSFRLSETKQVRFYHGQESPLPRPGEDVVLRLMVREAGSTLALPKEGAADVLNRSSEIPWHFAANVLDYARIMKGTNDYVLEQFDREVDDLKRQAVEDEYQFGIEDGEWTQRAIKAISTAREKFKNEPMDITLPLSSEAEAGKGKRAASQQFHFYTAPPHLYLAPLDIRILKTKFGDFSNFPTTLLPRVEHISTGHVVDDFLRKRAKYLGHLPQGCVVSFLECDWAEIVPPEILETFAGELERRRKSHRDKTAQEDRERLQAERLEAAAIGRGTRRHFENSQGHHFEEVPTVLKSEDFAPLGTPSGTTPPNPRPGFEQLASMSTSPSTARTVWGTTALPVSPSLEPVRAVDDGWLKDDDIFGAAEIALQMEAMGLEMPKSEQASSSGGGGGGVGGGSGGGKKKKKQKITLMSTGSRRTG